MDATCAWSAFSQSQRQSWKGFGLQSTSSRNAHSWRNGISLVTWRHPRGGIIWHAALARQSLEGPEKLKTTGEVIGMSALHGVDRI